MTPFKLCSLVVKIVSAILTPDGIYGGLDLCWRNEFQEEKSIRLGAYYFSEVGRKFT